MDEVSRTLLLVKCRPSQAQLALAISVVNSKPAHITVTEYIQQIRRHLKDLHNLSPSPTTSSAKYFDSVAFWKQAYSEAEATQTRLNDRIYELEQRVETLKLKLKQEDNVSETPERGKRKGSAEPIAIDSQRKRKKTSNVSSGIAAYSEAEMERLNELICLEDPGSTKVSSVMRHLSALQQNLHKRPTWSVIYSSAINLCTATASLIPYLYEDSNPDSNQAINTEKDMKGPDPSLLLVVIETAHTLLCHALSKILSSPENHKYKGQLVYHMVSLFEKVLSALEKISAIQTTGKDSPNVKHTPNNSSGKSPSAKVKTPSCSSEAGSASHDEVSIEKVLQNLRRTIAGMMLKASVVTADGCGSLFEGYLFTFLTRVGTVLSVLEFENIVLNPSLRVSSGKLPTPDGLRRAGVREDDLSEQDLMAYKSESRHLIWILEKAIALVHSVSMKSTQSQSTNKKREQKEPSDGLLLRLSKKRLQNTLLKAVFSEDEPLFLESLENPGRLAENETEIQVDEQVEAGSEWFSREVWRLLGWDILESIWKGEKNGR